jgi:hypothetical protein
MRCGRRSISRQPARPKPRDGEAAALRRPPRSEGSVTDSSTSLPRRTSGPPRGRTAAETIGRSSPATGRQTPRPVHSATRQLYMATVSECALNRTTSLVGTRTSKFSNWSIKRISSQILINFESQELEVVEFGSPSAWPSFAQIGHPVRSARRRRATCGSGIGRKTALCEP